MLISPNFTIGPISSVSRLSLVLSHDSFGYDFLISEHSEGALATVITPGHGFESFPVAEAHNFSGIIIDDIKIEVDLDLSSGRALVTSPLGSIVRKNSGLFLRCAPQSRIAGFGNTVSLVQGLSECADNFAASFLKWSIMKGVGEEKKCLYSIDVSSRTEVTGGER